jgi:hypothetical protein
LRLVFMNFLLLPFIVLALFFVTVHIAAVFWPVTIVILLVWVACKILR